MVTIVTATTYKLIPADQGIYGTKMASGYKVNVRHPERDRIVAVSRDLLETYPFHTYIEVTGAGKFDGVWLVEDVMAPNWHNRIDFLIGYKTKQDKFENVKIERYEICNCSGDVDTSIHRADTNFKDIKHKVRSKTKRNRSVRLHKKASHHRQLKRRALSAPVRKR